MSESTPDPEFFRALREHMRMIGDYAETLSAEFVTVRWPNDLWITYDEGTLTATVSGFDDKLTAEFIDQELAHLGESDVAWPADHRSPSPSAKQTSSASRQ